MLACEQPSGPPIPGLHLIQDQQCAALPAQRGCSLQVLLLRNVYAAFALHRLEQHGGCLGCHRLLQRGEIVERNVAEPGCERRKRPPVILFPRGRQSTHRAAVEASLCGDDPGASGRST